MVTFEELDALTSDELHDRAIGRARRHLDVKFFWRLLEELPPAAVARGQTGEAEADVTSATALLGDAVAQDDGLKTALRPLYIDYLLEHGGK